MRKLGILFLIFLCSPSLFAQIKYVPDDYLIIQHAINDAEDGDIIIVREGTYCQQINFKGKAITVASEFFLDGDTSHISNTIIDGMTLPERDSSSLIYFVSDEDTNSVLSGFTLQNGRGTKLKYEDDDGYWLGGGAILIMNSGGLIKNNKIKNNSIINTAPIETYGAGIEACYLPLNKTLLIRNNIIRNNRLDSRAAMGAAIDVAYLSGNVIIEKNEIIDNTIRAKDSGYGGGINILDYDGLGNVAIQNNYIFGNSTVSGFPRGGGVACNDINVVIRNNVILENSSELRYGNNKAKGGGISIRWTGTNRRLFPNMLHCFIENNTILFNKSSIGPGIHIGSSNVEIVNSIIRANIPNHLIDIGKLPQINLENDGFQDSYFTRSVTYSNIDGGFVGEGNIDVEPRFDKLRHYFLSPNDSKCVDGGNPSEEYFDVADPQAQDNPIAPAYGTRRNDMGAFGGPHSKWHEMAEPTDIDFLLDQIPNKAFLSQNYPNPFNPSTTIKYSIPKSSVIAIPTSREKQSNEITSVTSFPRNDNLNVSLKVHDILGREVETLVNEKQKPGNYEVTWEADQFSSGVYFYQLKTESFTKTRKMLLIK